MKDAPAVGGVLRKLQKAEPEIELLTGLIFPQVVELERGAFALLGRTAQTVSEAGDVASANGVNIVLDAQFVADLKGLIQAIEQYAKSAGIPKPAIK